MLAPHPDDRGNAGGPAPFPWKRLLLWALLFAVVLLGLRMIRQGKAAWAVALAAPVLGMVNPNGNKHPSPSNEWDRVLLELQELASTIPLVTPTELFAALGQQGFVFPSVQAMGRELGALGLHSEIQSVPGRPERRWYDLNKFTSHGALS